MEEHVPDECEVPRSARHRRALGEMPGYYFSLFRTLWFGLTVAISTCHWDVALGRMVKAAADFVLVLGKA